MVGFLAPLFAAAIAKPAITAAVVGAGASLIGGKMNRDAQKKANEQNRPAAQRAQYEAAGINPLFGMSSGSYVPVQATSMGDAFATAGGHFARMFDLEHEKQLQETATRKENERLREALDRLSRPSVPTLMEREGAALPIGGDEPQRGNPTGGRGGRFIETPDDVAKVAANVTDRDVLSTPMTDGVGLTVVDNNFTGPVVVPGADGEPMGVDELFTLGVFAPPQMVYRRVTSYNERVAERRADREKAWRDWWVAPTYPMNHKATRADIELRRQDGDIPSLPWR